MKYRTTWKKRTIALAATCAAFGGLIAWTPSSVAPAAQQAWPQAVEEARLANTMQYRLAHSAGEFFSGLR